jgi:hypothetical protein
MMNSARAFMLAVTAAGNDAGAAGAGGSPGNGSPIGTGGSSGSPGTAGGISNAGGGAIVVSSLLALNNGGNCSGSVADGGHNLSFDDASCPGTFGSGDPKLGALQDNGGPSQTIALGHGSAAIDKIPAGGPACPATDQRGVRRPSGARCDVGAYELASPKATTKRVASRHATTAVVLATVVPNAGFATVRFLFGTTTHYDRRTRVKRVSGVTALTVRSTLTGLTLGQRYHYRVIVVTMDGTANGIDRTFVIHCVRHASGSGRCVKFG